MAKKKKVKNRKKGSRGTRKKSSLNLTDTQREFIDRIFYSGIIKFGSYRLKHHESNPDAPLSPYYINLRLIPSNPSLFRLIPALYEDVAKQCSSFEHVAPVPHGATPFASLLASRLILPLLVPRTEKKTHGIQVPIDGIFRTGESVLLVDDLITSATSKIEMIEFLKQHRLKVKDVVVLIDRGQGGKEVLEEIGVALHSFVRFGDILKHLRERGKIDAKVYKACKAYNPNI